MDIKQANDGALAISKSDERALADSMANEWSLREIIMTEKYMIRMVGISWLAGRRRLSKMNAKSHAEQQIYIERILAS